MDVSGKEVEVVMGPLAGFKVVGIPDDPSSLIARNGHTFTPGVNKARCRYCEPKGLTAPVQEHGMMGQQKGSFSEYSSLTGGCGLHAFYDLSEALLYPITGVVTGVVNWGRTLFDEHFMRSEYQQIIAFAEIPDEGPRYLTWSGRMLELNRSWLRRASKTYGVPVIPLDELEDYTMRYGFYGKA